MIIGKNYYEESQKLFSTGNEDLDDILEEVYYSGIEDGYDYAQKEFGEDEEYVKKVMEGWGNKKIRKPWLVSEKEARKILDEEVTKAIDGGITKNIEKDKAIWDKALEAGRKRIRRKGATRLALAGTGIAAATGAGVYAYKKKKNKK